MTFSFVGYSARIHHGDSSTTKPIPVPRHHAPPPLADEVSSWKDWIGIPEGRRGYDPNFGPPQLRPILGPVIAPHSGKLKREAADEEDETDETDDDEEESQRQDEKNIRKRAEEQKRVEEEKQKLEEERKQEEEEKRKAELEEARRLREEKKGERKLTEERRKAEAALKQLEAESRKRQEEAESLEEKNRDKMAEAERPEEEGGDYGTDEADDDKKEEERKGPEEEETGKREEDGAKKKQAGDTTQGFQDWDSSGSYSQQKNPFLPQSSDLHFCRLFWLHLLRRPIDNQAHICCSAAACATPK